MKSRILTAMIGAPLVLAALFGPVVLTKLLIGAVALIAAYEFLRLTEHQRLLDQSDFTIPLILIVFTPLIVADERLLGLFLALIGSAVVLYFSRLLPFWFLGGVLYLGIPLATIIALRMADEGIRWILLVLVATWSTDTMALFGGKAFGRTPLTSISPKKTREGTVIGVVCGAAAILLAGWLLGLLEKNTLTIILAAILLPPLAVIGDLIESKIKRTYGKKDSGSLLPGHGGMLDRIDSLLLTAPTVWLLVVLTV